MSEGQSFDILIVGGGLAGAALGCALRGTGLRVGILEAVPIGARGQPSYDDRSIALAHGSQRIFHALGLWPQLAPHACPIRRIHISNRGFFGFTRLNAHDEGVEALGYVIENRAIGAVVGDALTAAENVVWIAPATVTDVALDEQVATVCARINGELVRLSAKLVVAADGDRSIVRESLAVDVDRRRYDQAAVIANVTAEKPHDHVAYERFTASGPLALLPMTEGRCSLVWMVPPEEQEAMLALGDDEFLKRLQDAFGWRLGRFVKVGKRAAYPLALARARQAVLKRAVLIGNAAHSLHPVAGQGFNLSLRDVAVLAELIYDAHRDGADFGSQTVLQRYHAWRERDQGNAMLFTDVLARVFANPLGLVAKTRNAGLIAVDVMPPVKHLLTRFTMGLAGRQSRLGCGLPLLRTGSIDKTAQRISAAS